MLLGVAFAMFWSGSTGAELASREFAKVRAGSDSVSMLARSTSVRDGLLTEGTNAHATLGALGLGPRATIETDEGAPSTSSRSAIVRVVIRVTDERLDLEVVPELHAVGEGGRLDPVKSDKPSQSLQDVLRAVQQDPPRESAAATRDFVDEFRVTIPGRYRSAWHAWLRVRGTDTWRTLRGQASERVITEAGTHEILVDLSGANFELDPTLDAHRLPASGFSEKDG